MDSRRKGHRWQPNEDLPPQWSKSAELAALLDVWQEQKAKLEGSTALDEFQARLIREWSIETGILERIYTLGKGITLTLIEQGFDASLISHGDSDLPPQQLVRILEDHREAVEGLFAFVKHDRALSTSYVKELHAVLTRHQSSCEAIDSLGRLVEVPLIKGDYKKLPNNPGDPSTGEVSHEYCPPEHVAAEMERLVAIHRHHRDVPHDVEAAWLHHRFTQIHPFQDGNGRVARALGTLVCLRGGGFALVVTRDHKADYLSALAAADAGDLEPLIVLFRRLQKDAFVRALGLSQSALDRESSLQAIVQDAKRRLEIALLSRVDGVQSHAARLADLARSGLQTVADRLRAELGNAVLHVAAYRSREEDAHYLRGQILATAKHFDYFANLAGRAHWARLLIRHGIATDFVVSLHHLGRIEDGVMVATTFLSQRSPDTKPDADQDPPFRTQPACDDIFTFTASRDAEELDESFGKWLDRSLQIGLDAWRRSL